MAADLFLRVDKQPFLTKEQEETASTDLLVLSHGRLVVRMARKFSRYGIDFDDLVQEGNLALMTAAEKFEPAMGYRFSTYAHWWISQRMRETVMTFHSVVRTPSTPRNKATFFKQRPYHDISTEATVSYDGITIGETLISDDPRPDELAERLVDGEKTSKAIRRSMRVLTSRERTVIQSRYLTEKPLTLDTLGTQFGVSKERVRQIELSALAKLRESLVI